MFLNRREAGALLAEALLRAVNRVASDDLMVLSIPRGGVVVGAVVAETLQCDHDVIVVKKIGFPGQEEFAAGAMAEDGEAFLNPDVVMPFRDDPYFVQDLAQQIEKTRAKIERYVAEFRQGRSLPLAGRTVIVVDDGIATGETVKAAVRWLKARPADNRPHRVIVAAPVCSPHTARELKRLADEVICVLLPADFHAVGQFYREFEQVDDSEVRRILVIQQQKA